MGFSDLAGLLWGHKRQHQQDIPLSFPVLTFCSYLRFKGMLRTLFNKDASVFSYLPHQMDYLFLTKWKIAGRPLPAGTGELCQDAKKVRALWQHAGWDLLSCQWPYKNILGTRTQAKILVERRQVVSWEEGPQRQLCCRQGLSPRLVKDCFR